MTQHTPGILATRPSLILGMIAVVSVLAAQPIAYAVEDAGSQVQAEPTSHPSQKLLTDEEFFGAGDEVVQDAEQQELTDEEVFGPDAEFAPPAPVVAGAEAPVRKQPDFDQFKQNPPPVRVYTYEEVSGSQEIPPPDGSETSQPDVKPIRYEADDALRAYAFGQFEKAFKLAEPLAKAGNAEAQFILAAAYRNGKVVKRDLAQARLWERKAAEQGHPSALHVLCDNCQWRETFVPHIRYEIARRLPNLEEACSQGITLACEDARFILEYFSVAGYEHDYSREFPIKLKLAEDGDRFEAVDVALSYVIGRGITENHDAARMWAVRAARVAPGTLFGLAYNELYLKGDYDRAFVLLEAAAQAGHVASQFYVGNMYMDGHGVKPDIETGMSWYRKAAAGGETAAMYNLGIAYSSTTYGFRSPSAAAEWFYRAGIAYLRGNERDDALLAYDQIVKVAPTNALAHKLHAQIYRGDGMAASKSKQKPKSATQSLGTGWITASGQVVTCSHVIGGSKKITVVLPSGERLKATVAARDDANDIALLSLSSSASRGELRSLPIAAAPSAAGAPVFTIGFPHPDIMGSTPKLSDGVISSTKGLGDDPRAYQITVPLQSGNSGGPILNMKGEVVGIATSKLNAVKLFQWTGDLPQNVNYALKTDYLMPLLRSSETAIRLRVTESRQDSLENLAARAKNAVVMIVAE